MEHGLEEFPVGLGCEPYVDTTVALRAAPPPPDPVLCPLASPCASAQWARVAMRPVIEVA